MKNNIDQKSKLLSLLGFLFLCNFFSFGQKIVTDTIDNQVFYVYPFEQPLAPHNNYYLALKKVRYKKGKYTFKQYYIDTYGEDYDKKIYRKAKREIFFRKFGNRKYNKSQKHLNGAFKTAVRKNPYPLLEPKYSLEKDVVPYLDEMPDGRYIQYFEGYFAMDQKGKIDFNKKQIAGIFSIKDNMLHGDAVWLNIQGDTLKKGRFENGQKVGDWFLEVRRTSYSFDKEEAQKYINRGYPDMDTTKEFLQYKGGFMNGKYSYYLNSKYPIMEGQYTENEMTGEWLTREIGYTGVGKNRKRIRNNQVITERYTATTESPSVKQALVRKRLIRSSDYSSGYNFDPKYDPNIQFTKIYSLNYPEEENLDMSEEKINSYEGELYEDDMYFEDEMYYGEDEYYDEGYYGEEDDDYSFKNMVYDVNSGKYYSLAHMIDSIGVKFNYDGIYEKSYPNGQLMMRYTIDNGKLLREDTIFWDNGKVYDVVNFQADSNQYIQRVYDYNGKLFNEIVFDSKGEFVRVNFQPAKLKYVYIDGFKAEDRGYAKYYFYDKLDTLQYELKDSLVLFRSWFKDDSSLLYSRSYIPSEHLLKFNSFAANGKPYLDAELTFSENFESWTGFKNYRLGNLTVNTTSSAAFSDFVFTKDSIPQRNMNDFMNNYVLTEDFTLKQNNKPFTGNISMTINEKKFSLNSGSSINISLPRAYEMTETLRKDIDKLRESGKSKNDVLLATIDASEIDEDFSSGIFSGIMGGFVGQFIEFPYSDYYDEGTGKYNEKKDHPFSKKISGYMKDGKPQGVWKIYDQFGKILYEIPFEKGMVNGTLKEYATQYPRSSGDYFNYEMQDLLDSMPAKKTHYLFSTREYKNDQLNGVSRNYNWYGQIRGETIYKDGMKNGHSFERNNLAYTDLNYLDGALDGYVKTYLTLKGSDSILLYDLNFQNGLLQGESKAFHTNGKLAKRGFFLNGDPIEDYEAYDSLGFKYHYVKFLYSYPVEEKIWEENELSVRYLFDWRDSIEFRPTDITTSQSLDRVLAQLGLGGGYYNQPYYGRPSIVNKTGIDYHVTKYYPNDTIARDGSISAGKKVGCWKYYNYYGEFLYEVDYFDTIISIDDSIKFSSKGLLTDFNAKGEKISESYIIEKFEKYDCSHTDHYEIRQLMTVWVGMDSIDRMNGYVRNFYDNGVLQNEGQMKNGLPVGVWKFYDPFGKLNQVGSYVKGKRDGRWLGGDLSKTKYLGDICLNPNLPDLEEEIKYREKLLDITITNYKMGKALNKEFYDVNMNNFDEEELEEEIEIER